MEHVHERLGAILAGPGFYRIEPTWYERLGEAWHRLRAEALDWLLRTLFNAGDSLFSGGGWVVGILAIVGLFLIMLLTLRTARRGWVREGRSGLRLPPATGTGMQPEALLRKAEGAREEGDYKEAVRYVYQAALAQLATKGVLSIKPHATNWEYLRQARKLPHDRFQPFSQLTRLFEQIWYGGVPAGDDDYKAGVALAQSIFE